MNVYAERVESKVSVGALVLAKVSKTRRRSPQIRVERPARSSLDAVEKHSSQFTPVPVRLPSPSASPVPTSSAVIHPASERSQPARRSEKHVLSTTKPVRLPVVALLDDTVILRNLAVRSPPRANAFVSVGAVVANISSLRRRLVTSPRPPLAAFTPFNASRRHRGNSSIDNLRSIKLPIERLRRCDRVGL